MRKQYHLWPSADGDGLDAWDVDRLIDLSARLPIEHLDVDSIDEVDTAYWFDPSTRPTVRAVVEHVGLIDAVDLTHPIIVGPDGRVMDGMHRIARCLLDGIATIAARRLVELPEPDFRNCHPQDLPYD